MTIPELPNEDDTRLRLQLITLAESAGIEPCECSVVTYAGEVPIDKCTLRIPGGAATGTFEQLVGVLLASTSLAEFKRLCRMARILDN